MTSFIDTNILLYAISNNPAEREKTAVAGRLLQDPDSVLSIQILQEFYVQATRASRPDRLPHSIAIDLIETWRRFTIVENTWAVFSSALSIKSAHTLSLWDCLVIAAAVQSECDVLYTEDLAHGSRIAGIRIVNPFASQATPDHPSG